MPEDVSGLNKEVAWEALKTSGRPGLIIEVGPSGTGALVLPVVRNEFRQGKYQQCRYLAIDPDPAVERLQVLGDFVLTHTGRVEESRFLGKYRGEADEVWIVNFGSLAAKKEQMLAVREFLKKDGVVVVLDAYSGLADSLPKEIEGLKQLGFEVEDFSAPAWKQVQLDHPLVEGWKTSRLAMPSLDKPVALRLRRRE